MNSLHTHSSWSDGENTIREMALAARSEGLSDFGISDHLVLLPPDVIDDEPWWIEPSRLGEYFAEASEVKAELSDETFTVHVGIEADFFPETVDRLREMIALYDFDYVIGAVHYAGSFSVDHSAEDWKGLTPDECADVWRKYIEKLHGLCESHCFDWVAHLDLPKKYGYPMPKELRPRMEEVLHHVAETEIAIELNTAGLDKTCREAYPSRWMLELAAEQAIPVALTSDAHANVQVARHFREGAAMLAQCGVRPAEVSRLFHHRWA